MSDPVINMIFLCVIWIMAFSIINRICNCIEACSKNKNAYLFANEFLKNGDIDIADFCKEDE